MSGETITASALWSEFPGQRDTYLMSLDIVRKGR
jgi:hypothetical protein